MGIEGKDRQSALDAGAAALSSQLGHAVQRLRKGYGLSLSELSTQSGVAKSIISQIERNETNPTLSTIWRLAHALDVSIESILHGAEDEVAPLTEVNKLVADLRAAKVNWELEIYSGAQHGFTNPTNAAEERADREYKVAIQRFFKEIFGT